MVLLYNHLANPIKDGIEAHVYRLRTNTDNSASSNNSGLSGGKQMDPKMEWMIRYTMRAHKAYVDMLKWLSSDSGNESAVLPQTNVIHRNSPLGFAENSRIRDDMERHMLPYNAETPMSQDARRVPESNKGENRTRTDTYRPYNERYRPGYQQETTGDKKEKQTSDRTAGYFRRLRPGPRLQIYDPNAPQLADRLSASYALDFARNAAAKIPYAARQLAGYMARIPNKYMHTIHAAHDAGEEGGLEAIVQSHESKKAA